MSNKESTFLNIRLKGKTFEIVNSVIEKYGFESKAETIRYIINQYNNYETKQNQVLSFVETELREIVDKNKKLMEIIEKLSKNLKD